MKFFFSNRRILKTITTCSCLLLAGWLMGQGPSQPADIVLHNGTILTVDDRFSITEAVAIRGHQFSMVGRNSDVLALAGPKTLVIDLKGKTAIPGLFDTHRHLYLQAEGAYGVGVDPSKLGRYPVDWRGVNGKDDVLNQMKNLAEKYRFKPGEWVDIDDLPSFGGSGSVEVAQIINEGLNRWELDKVFPNNPVAVSIGTPEFNEFLVNSKAIEILWEKYGDFIKKYGRYGVDSSGSPDGHLEPPASWLVKRYLPGGSPETLAGIYKKYIEEMNAMGVTTISTRLPPHTLEAFQFLESKGNLTLRIGYGREEFFGTATNPAKDMKDLGKLVGTGTDKLWVVSVAPTAADGATYRMCTNQKRLNGRGSMDKWWPNGQCFADVEYRGIAGRGAPVQGNYFREWILDSARYGVRFANTHVAGDRTAALLLGMLETAQKESGPNATKGWAVDHCFMLDPATLKKWASTGVLFSCYMRSERGPEIASIYGEKVANNFMTPVKSLLDAGAKVVFESDRDVYDWKDIGLLMTRVDNQGKVWGAHERVDRITALKMATRWAAEYVLKQDQLGSIEPGKLADLVVLDRDYMSIPVEQMRDIEPQLTVFDGKIVFVHSKFAKEYNVRPPGTPVATFQELKKRRTGEPGE